MEGVLKQVIGLAFPPLEVMEELEQKWEREELFAQMSELRAHIRSAESCFASVVDDDLIEASIYELASLKARYNYLMKIARRKEMVRQEVTAGNPIRISQKIKTWGNIDAKLGASRSDTGTADSVGNMPDFSKRT